MSNKNNTQWLETAKENFEQAVSEKNYKFARSILTEVNDNGFEKEADALMTVLRQAQFLTGQNRTGVLEVIEVGGNRMARLEFGEPRSHISLDKADVIELISALTQARELL